MKKSDVMKLWSLFNSLGDTKGSIKFIYFIAKNKQILKSEIESLQEVSKLSVSPRFLEYDEKRVKLNEKYCDKDDNGNPIIVDNMYSLSKENSKVVNKEIEELKKEYKNEIDIYIESQKELNRFLESEVELNLEKIMLTDLGSNLITGNQLSMLMEHGLVDERI